MSLEGATTTRRSKQMFQMAVFSLGPHPHGFYGGLEVKKNLQNSIFLGWECDPPVLKQSEAKNLTKTAVFNTYGSFLRGFWLLVAL